MTPPFFEPAEVTRIPKPWGYEIIWARTDRYVGKILHVTAGQRLSLQFHHQKDETLYLLRGKVKLTLQNGNDRREIMMEPGQAFHIPPLLIHRLEALEDSDLAEASTTELSDVVRLEDQYGREGTTAP
jgi:mannose-6-phosphate isomerase-like protein (cupin superfamily)